MRTIAVMLYGASTLQFCTSIQWINASAHTLSQLYTDFDQCVLTNALNSAQSEFSSTGRTCVPPESVEERKCSVFAEYYGNIEFNYVPQSMTHVIEGLETKYPHYSRISDLLIRLNQSNRALVLVGDSITRNSIEALLCIIRKEVFPLSVSIFPPLEKILYNAVHYTIHLPRVTVSVIYYSLWHAYQHGKGGTTTALHGELHRFIFNKHHPDLGALIVFNIGMHERGQKQMTKNLNEMFSYVQDFLITLSNRNITFLYRESSVQHYDTPAGLFNHNTAKKWRDGTMPSPTCVPWCAHTNASNWRHSAERVSLSRMNFEDKNIIRFMDASTHYWDVHAASPFFKGIHRHSKRKRHASVDEDCTHFIPTATPFLYRLLWHEILSH